MDYHQNARLTVFGREQLARKVLVEGLTLKLAAASFNVSEKTAAKWARRYQHGGVAALADRSSRPHLCARMTSCILLEEFWLFAGSATTAGGSRTQPVSAARPSAASSVAPA